MPVRASRNRGAEIASVARERIPRVKSGHTAATMLRPSLKGSRMLPLKDDVTLGRQASEKPQGRKPRARFTRWCRALWGMWHWPLCRGVH